jgi:peptidoglycan/LPS O-acetylase OafA/YrhL
VDTEAMSSLGNYKILYYLFTQNWIHALALVPIPEYLGQLWSLAIEEQFYVIWPILIYRLKNKTFFMINILIIGVVLLYRLYVFYSGSMDNPSVYLYFSTLTRIDTIIIGSSIALLFHIVDIRKYIRYCKYMIPVLISLMIVFAFHNERGFIRDNSLIMTFGFTIIGLIYGCLLILSLNVQESSMLRFLLRSDILSFFGKYSYAMYLFHMPIIVIYIYLFKKIDAHGFIFWFLFLTSSLATTVIAALISWHTLEKPFLQLKRYFE